MASILVIGVGSTGLSAMEQAQQFYYEFTKQNSPGKQNSAFLFLETDSTRKPRLTPNGTTDIVSCYLCPQNITATLTNWKGKYKWMPAVANVLNSHTGAAGQPTYGRIALWEQENTVRNNISQLYAQIGGSGDTNIYIVGSLTGGTGTGIFLDLAYMIRQITGNNNIYGMFMLPNKGDVGNITKDVIYENAFSSLRALDKFSKAEKLQQEDTVEGEEPKKGKKSKKKDTSYEYTNFQCVLPGGTDISNLSAPFYNVQFFTQDFSDATASMTTLSQLVQSVGFNIALRMLDVTNQDAPFQSLINARLVDYTGHVPDGIFTSIGMNVFQYPEGLLEEYFTTKQLDDTMLRRWADTTNFIDIHGTPHAIETLKNRISLEATRFVHDSVEKAIEKCQSEQMLGKATFHAALETEIANIQTGNYQAPSLKHYLFSLLDADSSAPKFYSAISGQATLLRDELIVAIANKIEQESTSYQNIEIVKLWMDNITKALLSLVNNWQKRYSIDGTPSGWKNCWQKQFNDRLEHGGLWYSMLASKREWYKEAIGGAAKLCYFNAFIKMIEQINDAIVNKNGTLGLSTASGIAVPTVRDYEEIVNRLAILLNPQHNDSLVGREKAIYAQLTNNANPQLNFLYVGDKCDDDVISATGKYHALPKRLSYSDISGDSLWHFLLNPGGCNKIRAIMIAKGLAYIQQLSLFANTDVVQIMQNLPQSHHAYQKVNNLLTAVEGVIRKDVPAMVSLVGTEQFYSHHCLKLIVATPLPQNVGVAQLMSNAYPVNTTASNYVQLPSMKNTVVVYQEYGFLGNDAKGANRTFNPLSHLSYQDQVLSSLKNKIKNAKFDEKVRLAYIDKQTLIDTKNFKIK